MPELVRFGVSMEKELSEEFEKYRVKKGYSNRSETLRRLIRNAFVEEDWGEGRDVAGAITLVYDHHRREILNKITGIQHDFQTRIISTQHIHLDHNNCLEIIAVKGKPSEINKLADKLKSIKGVDHGTLSMTAIGKKKRRM